eukprot:TRINITY_DN50367_c0_g1_i1.p1 TRINITY_DN50367_c0_g1~~TRINITY_DN50367_c0_g1_i1.p1  ORF type:complete len:732 (+),score=231.44 TRINITY_DN50367_c0_g1_i1:75-2198(+)
MAAAAVPASQAEARRGEPLHAPGRTTPSAASGADGWAHLRTPAPHSVGVTTADVLQLVANHPGSTGASLGASAVRRIWSAVTAAIAEAMLSRTPRGVQLPGFGVFTIRRARMPRGTWGDKHSLVPTFCLLPAFCQAHAVERHSQHTVQSTHDGSAPVAPLNLTAAAIRAGVKRDAAVGAVKDILRTIGLISSKGATFAMDFGVAQVVFHAHRYEVFWNQAALERMAPPRPLSSSQDAAEVRGVPDWVTYPGAADELPAAPTPTASGTPRTPTANRRRLRPASAAVAARGPGLPAGADLGEEPDGRFIDRAADGDVVSTVRSRLRQALSGGSSAASSQAASRLSRSCARSAEQPSPAHSAHPADAVLTSSVGSPAAGTGQHIAPVNEKYIRRKHRKLLYRRMRNKTAVDVWDEQKHMRDQAAEESRREEFRRARAAQEWTAAAQQLADKEQAERRQRAKEVLLTNRRLAEARRSQVRQDFDDADAFAAIEDYRHAAPDLGFLHRQMERRRNDAAAQKGLAAEQRQRVDQDYSRWREEEERRRKHRKEETLAVTAHLEKQLQEKEAKRIQEVTQEKEERPGGGSFFFPAATAASLVSDDAAGRRRRRAAALEVQAINQNAVAGCCAAVRQERERTRAAEAEGLNALQKEIVSDMRAAEQRRRRMQREMAQAWDNQVAERIASRRRERGDFERQSPAPRQWRNESSSDED